MDDGLLDALSRAVREDLRAGEGSAAAPARIGRYAVEHELGRGGCGVVYLARDGELDRRVALKVMAAHPGVTSEEIERFHREARLAARLRHPGIVAVHDVGRAGDLYFIAMDYVAGGTLADRLRDPARTLPEKVRILEKAARALAHAHADGIVHRDLKPANILVDAAGEPHLTDFGLARSASPGGTITTTGTVMGTPAYMSPEQVKGLNSSLDARSDVYSLGVILYEAMTGRVPFEGTSVVELFDRILSSEPVAPSKRRRGLHRDLEQVCLKALDKEPRRRYRGATEFAEDLARWLAGEPVLGRPVSLLTRAGRRLKRHRLAMAVAAAGVIGIAGALLWPRQSGDPAREDRVKRLAALGSDLNDRKRELRLGRLPPVEARAALMNVSREIDEFVELHPGDPAGVYLAARARQFLGDFDAAERSLRILLERHPEFRLGWSLLGSILFEAGLLGDDPSDPSASSFPEAARRAAEAMRKGPSSGREREEAAKWNLTWTREDEVVRALASLLPDYLAGRESKQVSARLRSLFEEYRAEEYAYWLGHFAEDVREAAKWYLEANRLAPGYEWPFLTVSNIKCKRGDHAGAIKDLNRFVALRPDHPAGYYNRGNVHRRLGDLQAAIEDYDRALVIAPRDFLARCNRGTARMDQGDLDGALADLEICVREGKGPMMATWLLNRSLVRKRKGDRSGSLQDLRAALDRNPSYALALVHLGILLLEDGDERGFERLDAALGLEPRNGEARYHRGKWTFQRKRGLAAAREDADIAVEELRSAKAYQLRGMIRRDLKDLDGALADLQAAVGLEPKSSSAAYTRGTIRDARGESSEAIADYSLAISLDYENWDARYQRAKLRAARGEPGPAMEDLDLILARFPDHDGALLTRGMQLTAMGDYVGALRDLDRARSRTPLDPVVLYNRAAALAKSGRLEDALAEADECLRVADPTWPHRSAVETWRRQLREFRAR